jgi:hypothetical protein
MNKKLIISVLLVVCLLAVAAVVSFAQPSPNVRWEYMVINTSYIEALNQLGREGWELVSTIGNPGANNDRHYFKRRLP